MDEFLHAAQVILHSAGDGGLADCARHSDGLDDVCVLICARFKRFLDGSMGRSQHSE